MTLDDQTLVLIAVGASVAANCQPCLERNVDMALKHGINKQQICEAIEIGKRVRQGAAAKMDKFISDSSNLPVPSTSAAVSGCGCG